MSGNEEECKDCKPATNGEGTGEDGTETQNDDSPRINEGQQGKHIPGHNNYDPERSELTHPDPQGLLNRGAGTGEQVGNVPVGEPGSKERVDFGEVIGNYANPNTGEKTPTTIGIIHYGSRGAHIVPARPKNG
jgi:filamentous hemagglutinin